MIKKGQLRRWKDEYGWHPGKTFVMIKSRIVEQDPDERRLEYDRGLIREFFRGRRVWTVLMDGTIAYENHMVIERMSEVIE